MTTEKAEIERAWVWYCPICVENNINRLDDTWLFRNSEGKAEWRLPDANERSSGPSMVECVNCYNQFDAVRYAENKK